MEKILSNEDYLKQIIDILDANIPPQITLDILEQYKTQVTPSRSGLLNYFVKHKLKMLIEHIGDF